MGANQCQPQYPMDYSIYRQPGDTEEQNDQLPQYIDKLESAMNKRTNASSTMNESQMRSYIAYLESQLSQKYFK